MCVWLVYVCHLVLNYSLNYWHQYQLMVFSIIIGNIHCQCRQYQPKYWPILQVNIVSSTVYCQYISEFADIRNHAWNPTLIWGSFGYYIHCTIWSKNMQYMGVHELNVHINLKLSLVLNILI